MATLDREWFDFLLLNNVDINYPVIKDEIKKIKIKINDPIHMILNINPLITETKTPDITVSKDYELSISTQTKVLFLNYPIDIEDVFWKIPIIEYWKPEDGVIKKQMKIISQNKDDYNKYKLKLSGIKMYDEQIIKQIDNPLARSIKFKDERKLTIGISKKDLLIKKNKKK